MRTKEQRQERIVEILSLLHQGGSFEEAKRLFNEEFDGVDVTEITSAEKALIQSGLDPSEIQRLCNIHAAVFKGSINEIHHSNEEYGQPGHPVHTLKLENQVLQSLLTDEIDGLLKKIKKGTGHKRTSASSTAGSVTDRQTLCKKRNADLFIYGEVWHLCSAESHVGSRR